jgi:hypothetical protein
LKIKKQLVLEKNKLVAIGMDDQQNFSHLKKKTIQLGNQISLIIILVWVTNQTSISVKRSLHLTLTSVVVDYAGVPSVN